MLLGRPFLLSLNEILTEQSREWYGHLLPSGDSILQAQIPAFPCFLCRLGADAFHNCCYYLPEFFSFARWREVLVDLKLFNRPLLLSQFGARRLSVFGGSLQFGGLLPFGCIGILVGVGRALEMS